MGARTVGIVYESRKSERILESRQRKQGENSHTLKEFMLCRSWWTTVEQIEKKGPKKFK